MSNPYKLNLFKYSTHNIIKNQVGNNNCVLDIGCNDGYISEISDKSNIFYGLDYSEESVKKAKKTYKDAIKYDLNYLEKLPWGKKFDVLIFADVLEHVLSADEVLSFFVENYLNKNGKVIISLPNIANWQIRLNLLFGKFEYTETGIMDRSHLHLYTFKTAKKLLERSNLKVVEVYGGASFFGGIIKILPMFKTLLATNIIYICEINKKL